MSAPADSPADRRSTAGVKHLRLAQARPEKQAVRLGRSAAMAARRASPLGTERGARPYPQGDPSQERRRTIFDFSVCEDAAAASPASTEQLATARPRATHAVQVHPGWSAGPSSTHRRRAGVRRRAMAAAIGASRPRRPAARWSAHGIGGVPPRSPCSVAVRIWVAGGERHRSHFSSCAATRPRPG